MPQSLAPRGDEGVKKQAGSYRGGASCLCGGLPASEWCRSTGLASGDDSPAGWLLQGRCWLLVFVGACLQANRAGQPALPQATIRQQAGSYRGAASCLCGSLPASEWCRAAGLASGDDSPAGWLLQGRCILSLWELACKRMVPVNRPCLRRRFASRLAPTGGTLAACLCRSLPASEWCRSTGLASGDDSPAGWLLQERCFLPLWPDTSQIKVGFFLESGPK